jgi:hypothetical protein
LCGDRTGYNQGKSKQKQMHATRRCAPGLGSLY